MSEAIIEFYLQKAAKVYYHALYKEVNVGSIFMHVISD